MDAFISYSEKDSETHSKKDSDACDAAFPPLPPLLSLSPSPSLRSLFDGVYVMSLPWREDRRRALRELYGDTLLQNCTWLSGRALTLRVPSAADAHAALRTPLTDEERAWLGPSWTLGANPQAACALAHMHAWKRALADGCKLALFFEDDVRFDFPSCSVASYSSSASSAGAPSSATASASASIERIRAAIRAHQATPRSKRPRNAGAEAYFLGGIAFGGEGPSVSDAERQKGFAFRPLQSVCTTVAYALNDVALRALSTSFADTGVGYPVDYALQTFIRAHFGGDNAYVCLHPEFAWQTPEGGSDILGIPSSL